MSGFRVENHSKDRSMVVIRLARGGAKKRPFYNIVVADSRERRDGRYLERVGFYNPMAAGGEESLRVVFDRVNYWQGVGAQASDTVLRLLGQAKKKAVGAEAPAAVPAAAPAAA
jgi:small subunit ribosomal protein S16